MKRCIGDAYSNLKDIVYNEHEVLIDTYPSDTTIDSEAYKHAITQYQPGDVAIIFTPDDTHYEIALACMNYGLHVLVTKPVVKTLAHHIRLDNISKQKEVLVGIEVHKRYDPIYVDARDKIQQQLNPFSYIYSYMSQPKYQLDTFKAWAGKSSDISYYLNSHHIDFHEWCIGEHGRPVSVHAVASTGVATETVGRYCEDTITLTVQWEVFGDSSSGTNTSSTSTLGSAVYTASWIAPKSDVHSQQRFFYMGQHGEYYDIYCIVYVYICVYV